MAAVQVGRDALIEFVGRVVDTSSEPFGVMVSVELKNGRQFYATVPIEYVTTVPTQREISALESETETILDLEDIEIEDIEPEADEQMFSWMCDKCGTRGVSIPDKTLSEKRLREHKRNRCSKRRKRKVKENV